MSDHAPLAPSFAPVWGNCSGAPRASAGIPNLETEESRTGTAVHWVIAQVLSAFKGELEGPLVCSAYLGAVAENGVVIDEDMVEGAQVMVDDVLEVLQEHGAVQKLLVEHRVHMPTIHPYANWGTLDAAVPLPDKHLIYLWDYKNGHGENSPVDNFQLINYLEGLKVELGINGFEEQKYTVVFRIVHPFYYGGNGPVSEWRVKMTDLRGYINRLHTKAHEVETGGTLTTGRHCRHCPANIKCAARRKADSNFIDFANQPYQMDEMASHDLAVTRRILEDGIAVAKSRLKAVEDQLKEHIAGGDHSGGLTVETTYGHLKWNGTPEEAAIFTGYFGFDIKKIGCLTPTQAIQKAPKEIRSAYKEALKTMATRSVSGRKLINAQDSKTARAFKRK